MKRKTEKEIISSWSGDTCQPLVTIICITYNQIRYIERCLDSILSQNTSFSFELIIHDDASSDGTTEIVRRYAAEYPNIIIPVIQTENQYSKGGNWGHPKTINSHIRGKYTALCEGDDYWTDSGKLECQVSYMLSHPNCTMTFHAVNYVYDEHVFRNDRRSERETDFSVEEIIIGGGNFSATSSLCCRTDAYLQYPRFRTMALIGDFPLEILMGLLGDVHYFPKVMGVYRYQAEGSWTKHVSDAKGSFDYFKIVLNQMHWMTELNHYTDFRYENQISEQINALALDGIYIREQEISKLQAVYQSASWKVGNLLIQPLHALKMLVNKVRKTTNDS